MSDAPETQEKDFDLDLHFLPDWAKDAPDQNRYSNYRGEPEREERRRDRPDRRDRRDDRRPRPERRGPQDRPRSPRAEGGPPPRGDRRGPGPGRDRDRRGPPRPSAPVQPLPELNVAIVPEEKGVDSLARQIRMTGRAYPLFEIAQLILAKPDRYTVTASTKKKTDGPPPQLLFLCAVDDTLWLDEDEAVRWCLEKHFDLFYKAERAQIEPPKGIYTFVAQCGLTGTILGPPNYHDYQNRLRKLHQERFARMPFDAFKSRVKIVRDEAVVKQWLEEQSWKTEYVGLNLPEPVKFGSREEVEKHFRETHLPNIVKSVETHRLSGTAARNIRSPGLSRLVRFTLENQKRFPLQVATVLSQQFAARGLQFFKVNRTVTHVAVSRPHYLDLDAVPVSEGVRNIVNYINAHPRCSRRQLVEALAPSPPAPPPAAPPPTEGATEGAAPPPPAAESREPTPQQTAIIVDLHWLVHQGHVIEFANGTLETAKKPAPKPPKPAPAAAEGAPSGAPAVEAVTGESIVTPEAPPPAEPPAAIAEPTPVSEADLPEYKPDSRTDLDVSAGGEAEAVEPEQKQNA